MQKAEPARPFLLFSERRNVAAGLFDGAQVLDRMVTAKVTRLIAF
jgi:hypothetical protein